MPKKRNLCLLCSPGVRGWCCYYSVFIKGIQVVTDEHCRFLDRVTGNCTVYKERFEKNEECLPIAEMKKLGTLPRKCPYVQFDKAYQSRNDLRLYFDEFEIVTK